jgi:hypothetical protein
VQGPALIIEDETTTVLPRDFVATVAADGALFCEEKMPT